MNDNPAILDALKNAKKALSDGLTQANNETSPNVQTAALLKGLCYGLLHVINAGITDLSAEEKP